MWASFDVNSIQNIYELFICKHVFWWLSPLDKLKVNYKYYQERIIIPLELFLEGIDFLTDNVTSRVAWKLRGGGKVQKHVGISLWMRNECFFTTNLSAIYVIWKLWMTEEILNSLQAIKISKFVPRLWCLYSSVQSRLSAYYNASNTLAWKRFVLSCVCSNESLSYVRDLKAYIM